MKNSKELHKEFVTLAFDIIKMKNRLISLLLEIYEREIYKEQGCRTIYEYGFKYGKLSKEVIAKALRTLKHLQDKPCLKQAVETQGIHKVAMVATIATVETDKVLARHVESMSKAALFEFSKELRHGHEKCEAVRERMKIELDEEMQVIFLRLKEKYAKDCSNVEALKIMLKKLELDRRQAAPENQQADQLGNYVLGNVIFKKSSSVKTPDAAPRELQSQTNQFELQPSINPPKLQSSTNPFELHPPVNPLELQSPKISSRYIPVATKRKILHKYHHKCAYPNCPNPPQQMHHRVAFAFNKSHDSVMPLCRVHHEFAHNGLIAHELKEPEKWKLRSGGKKTVYDQLRLEYRGR